MTTQASFTYHTVSKEATKVTIYNGRVVYNSNLRTMNFYSYTS